MAQEHFYEVTINWNEGRIGNLSSAVLNNTIDVATPPEFPKGVAGIWSPEHLFVAAVNSCLMTTFLAIAENFKLDYSAFKSRATGKLEIVNGKYMISEIELFSTVTIADEQLKEKAIRVLEKSEAACLISNSITSKVILNPEVIVEQAN